MRHLVKTVALCLLLPLPAATQDDSADDEEDGGGFLTRTIEDALSGAGREVRIEGFAGALSSEATFDRMTIADDAGIWLELNGVSLVWSRAALLRGRLNVDSLTAQSLDVARLPAPGEAPPELPSAEAEEFSMTLPELPVSINIGAFEVAEIHLGAPLLGEATSLTLNASARLDDEGLFADVRADRIDGAQGKLALATTVLRDGAEIDLNLSLQEAANGIAATLLNLPGGPSVDLNVAGQGPLEDFTADIKLDTDAAPRLAGQVVLTAEAAAGDADADAEPGTNRRIQADLGGDITALIAPQYQDFFGTDVALAVDTVLLASGAIDVQDFSIAAQALDLAGEVRLNKDLWPSFVDVAGEIAQGGMPVVLPVADGGVTVEAITLDVDFDHAAGDALKGQFEITNVVHDALTLDRTALNLDGVLDGSVDAIGSFAADVTLDLAGLALAGEAGAQEALGDAINGALSIRYVEEQPLEISDIVLSGQDYGIRGDVVVQSFDGGIPIDLDVAVAAADLSRFSALAGQPLGGSADVNASGRIVPLSGMFDVTLEGTADDVVAGIAEVDALMAGQTTLALAAERSTEGTFLHNLDLSNPAVEAQAEAVLRSGASTVQADVRLADLALVVPDVTGPLSVTADATQSDAGWQVEAALDAPRETRANVSGIATGPDADLAFDVSVPNVGDYVPQIQGALTANGRLMQSQNGYLVDVDVSAPYDTVLSADGLATGPDADLNFSVSVPEVNDYVPQLTGPLNADGRVWQGADGYMIDVDAGGPVGGSLSVEGLATGPDANVRFEAGLPDLAVLVPQFGGAFDAVGDLTKAGDNWRIGSQISGPAGLNAALDGTAAADASTVDVAIKGALPLGLAGPIVAPRSVSGDVAFDLALKGAPGLDALSGRITSSNGQFSDPNLRFGLRDIATQVDITGNALQLDVGADIVAGGSVSVAGTLNLASLSSDLAIALDQATFIDPNLYAATLDADIALAGPLNGGARVSGEINVDEVNVSIPDASVTSFGAIPEIVHQRAREAVILTQGRAGVRPPEESETRSGPGPAFPLNIQINAPSRIFIRGRGLNAEVGGDLAITGTTGSPISAGSFDLIRGRLDVIGKRFDLDEGSVQFQGSATPFVLFKTTTEIPDGTASIAVEGPANEPEVTFSSDPAVPEDEVMALILFGRYVSELSAFQALQLANGVAQLTGRGGVNLIGSLRSSVGLDELDVTTDESGATSVSAGKYITEDIYTDITNNTEKGTDVSLNIDLTQSLTGRATVSEDGNSSLGLFYERDY